MKGVREGEGDRQFNRGRRRDGERDGYGNAGEHYIIF